MYKDNRGCVDSEIIPLILVMMQWVRQTYSNICTVNPNLIFVTTNPKAEDVTYILMGGLL